MFHYKFKLHLEIAYFLNYLCIVNHNVQAISGGYKDDGNAYIDHIVSLRALDDAHVCAGTIIDSNLILTAANCLEWGNKLRSVAVGSNRLAKTESYVIKKTVQHSTFNAINNRGDIALILIKENIVSKSTKFLNMIDHKPKTAENCTTLGWGHVGMTGPMPDSPILADFNIMTEKTCAISPIFTKGQICFQDLEDYRKRVQIGDSGGPLLCNGKLAGIISFISDATPASYATDIHFYKEWIDESKKSLLSS